MQRNRHTLHYTVINETALVLLGVVNFVSNISLFSDIRVKKLHIRTRALQS